MKLVIYLLFIALPLSGEALFIPPLLDGPVQNIYVREGELFLKGGTTETLGYNGDYLGPTLRFRMGEDADITIVNELREETTFHWHGMHIPAEFDGGPRQVIPAGGEWNPRFTIDQPAATLWYHPHLMGRTAEQVYRGLAGMIIIEDEYSDSLSIPSDYGRNDIPLILQDRRLNRKGEFSYRPSRHDIVHGYTGNFLLTNGQIEPELFIEESPLRLRILNGSNSTLMRLSLRSGGSFTVIASDGGFLPEAVERNRLVLSPGERYEILVQVQEGEDELISELYNGESFTALRIQSSAGTSGPAAPAPAVPSMNISKPWTDAGEPDTVRRFTMETRGMGRFTINGRSMDMNRIDFRPRQGTTEHWVIENRGRGMMMNLPHSFHVHDVQFRILEINGRPPPPYLSGPKDTVLLMAGDRVKISLRFEDYSGIYMYHCHMLEHEDAGMMGQFEVISPR